MSDECDAGLQACVRTTAGYTSATRRALATLIFGMPRPTNRPNRRPVLKKSDQSSVELIAWYPCAVPNLLSLGLDRHACQPPRYAADGILLRTFWLLPAVNFRQATPAMQELCAPWGRVIS